MANSGQGQMGTQNFGAAVAVTPHDTNANAYDALYIGVAGDVTIIPADGSTAVLLKAVPVGVLRVRTSKVKSTGTAATDIVGLTA